MLTARRRVLELEWQEAVLEMYDDRLRAMCSKVPSGSSEWRRDDLLVRLDEQMAAIHYRSVAVIKAHVHYGDTPSHWPDACAAFPPFDHRYSLQHGTNSIEQQRKQENITWINMIRHVSANNGNCSFSCNHTFRKFRTPGLLHFHFLNSHFKTLHRKHSQIFWVVLVGLC